MSMLIIGANPPKSCYACSWYNKVECPVNDGRYYYRAQRHPSCPLIELPSAQPETTRRIVGKSKGGMTLWYECERCGEPVDEGDKFCRGCGAKMEVTT